MSGRLVGSARKKPVKIVLIIEAWHFGIISTLTVSLVVKQHISLLLWYIGMLLTCVYMTQVNQYYSSSLGRKLSSNLANTKGNAINLLTFTTDTTGKVNILFHDGDTLGMNSTWVGILSYVCFKIQRDGRDKSFTVNNEFLIINQNAYLK